MLKNQKNNVATIAVIVIAGIVLLGGLTFGNYRFAKTNPGGNDFLTRWLATRLLITQGSDPYSEDVALKIQNFAYGAPAKPGEDEMRFAYPLYSILIFLPFAFFKSYTAARALWMTVLEVAIILIPILSVRLVRWRVSRVMLVVLLLFSVLWYHGLRALINGNVVVLLTLLLVGGFLALREGADELAGVLFAFSTAKPQVVVLVLAFVVIWAINQRRMKLVGWLFGTVLLLSASAALLVPNWIVENLREILRYPTYTQPGSPQAAFIARWPDFGARVGWALTAVMALIILVEWWNNRNAEFPGFLWAACLTMVAGQWTGIQTDPGNYIVLLPAMILAFSLLDDRWKAGGKWFVLLSLLGLLVGLWALFLNTVQRGAQPIQSPVMFFPLPAFLLIALYWVRWWAVEPPTVWYDMLDGR